MTLKLLCHYVLGSLKLKTSKMLSVRLPDFTSTDARFSKVLRASVIALDSPNKYHLTLLATCFLPAMLLSSFSNREVLYLQLRDFKGLPLKCIHQLSSRWFKTHTKTHACIFIHTHSFSFGKSFPFPLILHKIPRVQMSCEHWQLSSFHHWGTHTMCSSGHSFPFLHWALPSCTQWETQTSKMWWMPTPLPLALGVTSLPRWE